MPRPKLQSIGFDRAGLDLVRWTWIELGWGELDWLGLAWLGLDWLRLGWAWLVFGNCFGGIWFWYLVFVFVGIRVPCLVLVLCNWYLFVGGHFVFDFRYWAFGMWHSYFGIRFFCLHFVFGFGILCLVFVLFVFVFFVFCCLVFGVWYWHPCPRHPRHPRYKQNNNKNNNEGALVARGVWKGRFQQSDTTHSRTGEKDAHNINLVGNFFQGANSPGHRPMACQIRSYRSSFLVSRFV
jgi:hypothetical protein